MSKPNLSRHDNQEAADLLDTPQITSPLPAEEPGEGSARPHSEPSQSTDGVAVVGFGGGCHWCTEAVFQSLRGVERVEQGWICSAPPDAAESEAVRVAFRPDEIGLDVLIEIHLRTHSSASDHSMRAKYRSAVYTTGDAQHRAAERILAQRSAADGTDYVTRALPLVGFRLNQENLLDYYRTRPDAPFCTAYIDPKLAMLRERYAEHVDPGRGPGADR